MRHSEPAELAGLPSDMSSERYVIQASLRFERRTREYMALLEPEHFFLEAHRRIWATMRGLYESEAPVNATSLIAALEAAKATADVGGLGFLADLMGESVPDAGTAEHWGMPILETYGRRRMILRCNEAMIRLGDRAESPALIAQEIEDEARICAMLGAPSTGFADFAAAIAECGGFDKFLSRGGSDGREIAYPWQTMNALTNGGMRAGQMIVIAGPSGRGKTALALNIAFHAGRCGLGVPLIFSLEMDKHEINGRLLSLASGVDSFRFRNPSAEEMQRIRTGRQVLTDNPIMIDDEDSTTIGAIRTKAKKIAGQRQISMILVDYIQLVESNREKGELREQEIARTSRGLKNLGKKLKCPVVALSQINEDAGAGTREPELRDLRESRSIGHNANLVAFLHFKRRYDLASGIPTGDLDLILRKQRGGPEGRVALTFHAPTGRFYETETMNYDG